MIDDIMDQIIAAVRRVHGEDRWPSDVEQSVRRIEDLLREMLR
jgi:hypothetical protein